MGRRGRQGVHLCTDCVSILQRGFVSLLYLYFKSSLEIGFIGLVALE
jgi:hypothetical protein